MQYPEHRKITEIRIAAVAGKTIAAAINLRSIVAFVLVSLQPFSGVASAEDFRPTRTDSPRQTFETFVYLASELDLLVAQQGGVERGSDQLAAYKRWLLLREQGHSLIDTSNVPGSQIEELSSSTFTYLMDIFGRVDLPDSASIPDVDDEMPSVWRIPGTPIRIVAILDGPRRGEYLFDQRTIQDAPRFFQGIEAVPLRSEAGVESWTTSIPQLTGPLIPSALVSAIPMSLKRLWFDTAIWKVALVAALTLIAAVLLRILHRFIALRADSNTATGLMLRSLTPIAILLLAKTLDPIVGWQINVTGAFWRYYSFFLAVVNYLAVAWAFWLVTRALVEWFARRGDKDPESFDVQLRLVLGATIATAGSILILGAGAQDLGLPVYSIVAGLGVGGLAVALAIRPTLENLVGGIILYMDQPVRAGDYCTFGDKTGTVERVGIRTTKIRGLDRTLISVPNANFVNMELVNWAHCDMMLIKTTIGLRYETGTDQLRYVLVRVREMLHAHPKIDSDTVRVRFAGYGSSSLDVDVRIYALTHEWNAFFAIREDVFLRINDIVEQSGTNLALPSQTVYMTRDSGPSTEKSMAASQEVESWRDEGRLPFPTLSAERMKQIEDTLDWPPIGSVDAVTGDDSPRIKEESLSGDSDDGAEQTKIK